MHIGWSSNEPRHAQALRPVSLTPCEVPPGLGTRMARSSSQLGEHHRSAALSPSCTIAALVLLVCLALLGIPGSVYAGEQPDWLKKDTIDRLFPEAAYKDRALVNTGTQLIRSSTGLELQVLMPVFNQPFRIYWAYNPTRVAQFVQPPTVADRSYFPNNASFVNSILTFGQAIPYVEKKSVFRFTIGRTF